MAEHFHLTPNQVGELTDLQIEGILYHKRDKDGKLVPPATRLDKREAKKRMRKPRTLKQALASIEPLRNIVGNFAELEQKVREKYGPQQPPG